MEERLNETNTDKAFAYLLENETDIGHWDAPYGGKGSLGIKLFDFNKAAQPANFVLYNIPPGGSEGVHVHHSAEKEDAFEEFYYIVSGRGRMEINNEIVSVKAGDHIFVPRDIPHGIENISDEHLKVLITFIARG